MWYYEVWVASLSFHGNKPLTYSSETALGRGDVVQVPLQKKLTLGIVDSEVSKPTFKTKSLSLLPEKLSVPTELLQLTEWLSSYYPAPSGQIISLLLPSNLSTRSKQKPTIPEKLTDRSKQTLPALTADQEKVLARIKSSDARSYLLHGDTGTGKTRVYIDLAAQALSANKSALILTPEIGLTPQLVETFTAQFPEQTVVTHSHMTPAQRRDIWMRIATSANPLIIIGPRSALFTPINNLGLIVVDECHDNAYKQEQAPHYQTTRVAAQLTNLHKAKMILGSATPNIADYYTFESKGLPILRMRTLAAGNKTHLESIDIVAIRERDNFTRSPWLSNKLLEKIEKALDSGYQSLVFLNRRGSARVVLCQECGWQAVCPKCDIPLTYHGDTHRMLCHTCGHKSPPPNSCPECKAANIVYKSIGTKSLTAEVNRLFPAARVSRFDSDNLKSERLDKNHRSIQNGDVDILVGTQMLTKGLDLPKLAVVGVVTADTALFFPDFTAEEITFQQISQVVGRVGRGHVDGSVVIQTYYPENPALQAIVDKNYSLFYKQQISEREKFLFPPFSFILRLSCSRKSSSASEKACQKLYTFLHTLPLSIEIIGPSPSFKQKQNDMYHWQIIVKAKKRSELTSLIEQLPTNISYDIDPLNLL